MGLPSLGPAFCVLSLFPTLATAMAYTAILAASAATWAKASVIFVCSVAITSYLSVYFEIAFVCFSTF